MGNKILSYYGKINAAYLHAYAEGGTEFLLQELEVKKNETILEIGFGTGATLVKIKARNPLIQLYGLDASELMLKKSISRLKFCGLYKDVHIQQIKPSQKFPFTDGFFDTIYAESVLGIQETIEIDFIVKEVFRTLKPNGKLIINETIWLPNIEMNEIENINTTCKNSFGIIQANAEYSTPLKWEQLFKKNGFSETKSKPVKAVNTNKTSTTIELRSKLFSFIGKIKKISPAKLQEMKNYKKVMNSIYSNKKYLEGVLFIVTK